MRLCFKIMVAAFVYWQDLALTKHIYIIVMILTKINVCLCDRNELLFKFAIKLCVINNNRIKVVVTFICN